MTYERLFSRNIKNFFEGSFLLEKYIISELFPPFFLSLGIFSALGLAIGYLSDLSNKVVDSNLPILGAIEIFFLKIPEFVAYALPISVLLATLMTYGRLNNDNEVIAFQSCGVSIYKLITPALILSLAVTAVSFIFNEIVVPSANYRATSILVSSIKEEHSFWQNKDIFYPEYQEINLPNSEKILQLKNLFYAQKFESKQMKNLTVLQWLDENLSQIIIAESASWNEKEKVWDFFNGTIFQLKNDSSYRKTISFKQKKINLSKLPFQLASQGRDPYEMNLKEAWDFITILRHTGDEKKLLTFEIRTQQKMSFPFISIVFSMIGSVFGMSPLKMSRSTSFGLCIVIIFSYYVLAFLLGSLAMAKILTPVMAGWLPTVIALMTGGFLVYKLSK